MKTKLKLLSVLMLFLATAFTASAYDFEVDGIYYNKTSDTEVAVTYRNTNYNSYSGSVTIPASVTYGGTTYAVTSIGYRAFYGCSGLTSVTIGNSVTSIGYRAFYGCSGLTSVTIPNSVTSIGEDAFYGCSGLTSVTIPNSVTEIGIYAFSECSGLTSVTIPNSVTEIGIYAFSGCSGLTSVNIPNSVTSIGGYAFAWCRGLTSVTIGNSVTSISEGTFYYCSGLTSVTIPNSVTSIGNSAFSYCRGLTSVTIPNSVTEIGIYAFSECSGLTSVTIGSGVTQIGSSAFGNNSIPKVIWLCNTPPSGANNVSAKVNYVSNEQFSISNRKVYPFLSSKFEVDGVVYVPVSPSERTCDVIDCNYAPTTTDIVIDSIVSNKNVQLKVLEVNSYAFYGNDNITGLKIQNSGNIGNQAFYDCDALTTVEASNNGYIGNSAFYDCSAITTANLSNKGYIGDQAFYGCSKLESVTFGSKVTSIGKSAFYNCNTLKSLTLPDNISSLGESSFEKCSSLSNVSIGKGISSLPNSVFSGCSSLPSLTIPGNILSIGNYAFSACTQLADVTFEEVEDVETQTFADWTSTNHNDSSSSSYEYTITAKAGDVLSFEIWSDSESVFDILTVYLNGESLATISGQGRSKTIKHTFNTAGTYTLKVEYVKDSSTSKGTDQAGIRNLGVNILGFLPIELGSNGSSPLFASCPLDEVYIGRKLSYQTSKSYGYSPFYRNTSLRTVIISDIETQIYDNEFYGCTNLQEFSCGDGVTTIGKWAFSGCSAMTSFASGSKVESISEEAFSDCTGLTLFTSFAAVPPTCGNQALDDINKWECVLHVPAESISAYQAADQWKEFFFMEGVDDVITDEASGEVVGYYNLQGVRSDEPWDGLNIVVYSDGTRRKIRY